MSSPFPANATLTFHVPNGQVTTDSLSNVIPVVVPMTVKAYIAPDKTQSNRAPQDNAPGVDAASERMSGRMVEPMQVPPEISNLSEADAVINGQPGRFILRIPTQSPWATNQLLGDQIYGIFTPNPDRNPIPVATLDEFVAAIPLSGDRLVTLNGDGKLIYADHRIAAHASAIVGLTRTAVTVGSAPIVADTGVFTSSGWNWTPGLPLFLGINGFLTQDSTAITTGFLLSVGRALTAKQIILEIEDPILLE